MVFEMNKKIIIPIVITILVLSIMIIAYAGSNSETTNKSEQTMLFNVSPGSNPLNTTLKNIKTQPYLKDYDKKTIEWMETLGDNRVFYGNDSLVIMSDNDAEKILPDPGITDVYIYNYFYADVIENHSLGNDYPTVYYVENVDFINQEIVSNGLAWIGNINGHDSLVYFLKLEVDN